MNRQWTLLHARGGSRKLWRWRCRWRWCWLMATAELAGGSDSGGDGDGGSSGEIAASAAAPALARWGAGLFDLTGLCRWRWCVDGGKEGGKGREGRQGVGMRKGGSPAPPSGRGQVIIVCASSTDASCLQSHSSQRELAPLKAWHAWRSRNLRFRRQRPCRRRGASGPGCSQVAACRRRRTSNG